MLEEHRTKLEQKLMASFRASAPLLNLRRQQEHCAKQKNYQEAHELQQKALILEQKEKEQLLEEVRRKVNAAEANLINKQGKEMAALQKKLESKMLDRMKMREVEHNKILQRYQNVRKEIESQQNIERQKRERAYKVSERPGTGNSMQRSVMMSQTSSKMGSRMGSRAAASKPSNY